FLHRDWTAMKNHWTQVQPSGKRSPMAFGGAYRTGRQPLVPGRNIRSTNNATCCGRLYNLLRGSRRVCMRVFVGGAVAANDRNAFPKSSTHDTALGPRSPRPVDRTPDGAPKSSAHDTAPGPGA